MGFRYRQPAPPSYLGACGAARPARIPRRRAGRRSPSPPRCTAPSGRSFSSRSRWRWLTKQPSPAACPLPARCSLSCRVRLRRTRAAARCGGGVGEAQCAAARGRARGDGAVLCVELGLKLGTRLGTSGQSLFRVRFSGLRVFIAVAVALLSFSFQLQVLPPVSSRARPASPTPLTSSTDSPTCARATA